MRAKEAFLFNAIVRDRTHGLLLNGDGRPDIRILSTNTAIFVAIRDLMTGGETSEFRRGNITDPIKGYNLLLRRPAPIDKKASWTIICSPNPSPLYSKDEATTWGSWEEWTTQIHDIQAVFNEDIKSYDALYAKVRGGAPPESHETAAASGNGATDDSPFGEAEAATEEATEAPASGDDDPFAGFTGSAKAEPAKAKALPPKAAARPVPATKRR
jgi:hypothetical protein